MEAGLQQGGKVRGEGSKLPGGTARQRRFHNRNDEGVALKIESIFIRCTRGRRSFQAEKHQHRDVKSW